MLDTGLHMTTALAAAWLPWVFLSLVLLVWVSCMLQPQYLRAMVSNSFASFSVNAAEQAPSIGSQLAQWLFNCAVPAIAVYVLLTRETICDAGLFGRLLVISLLVDVARALIALAVQYTFRFGKKVDVAYIRYFSLRSMVSYVLLLMVLLLAYTQPIALWLVLLGVTTVAYLIILGVQLARVFCSSLTDVAGVVLYLVTVELLPAVLLYEAGRQFFLQQLA